jgi:hypothetical protein
VELKRLTGSDDLTLVTFCAALSSDDDVREYLTHYLGAGASVAAFANEFIRRKAGGWTVERGKGSAGAGVGAPGTKRGGKR